MCDADLGLDELPEDLLEGNETAIAFVDRRSHSSNVHHDEFFLSSTSIFT